MELLFHPKEFTMPFCLSRSKKVPSHFPGNTANPRSRSGCLNFYKQAALLLAVSAGRNDMQGYALAVESAPSESQTELVLFTVQSGERETVNRQIREAGLSPLHHIRAVVVLDAIPTLGAGKTDYQALKQRLISDPDGRRSVGS